MSERVIPMAEAMARFGSAEVKFNGYYKYTFVFVGEAEGKQFQLSVGGNSDDIYRFEVSDQPVKAEALLNRFFDAEAEIQEDDYSIKLWGVS